MSLFWLKEGDSGRRWKEEEEGEEEEEEGKRRVCEEDQVERDSLVNEETKLMRSGQCALCWKCSSSYLSHFLFYFVAFLFCFCIFCCFPRPKSQT